MVNPTGNTLSGKKAAKKAVGGLKIDSKRATFCVACSGTGKSSKGNQCIPCKGTGRKIPQPDNMRARVGAMYTADTYSQKRKILYRKPT